jgi:putative sterol carrier protein
MSYAAGAHTNPPLLYKHQFSDAENNDRSVGNTKKGDKMAPVYGSDEWEETYQEILQRRLLVASKPFVTGTPEWVDAYEKAVRADNIYKEVAAKWEGSVVLHTIAEPEMGVERDIYIFMDLWHGECRKMRVVSPEIGEAADYFISGSPTTWLRLGKGELNTNKAVMQGKIRLKGDLSNLVRYGQASARLGKISAKIRSRSYETLDQQEAEDLKMLEEEFVERLLLNGSAPGPALDRGYQAAS